MTCIGMAHPDLVQRALAAGAADVRFVGCPPEDCANREGNLWMQQRLERRRMPRLRLEKGPAAPHTPMYQTAWTAPNNFWRGLLGKAVPTPASAYEEPLLNLKKLLDFGPAMLLMAVILVVQLILSSISFQPYAGEQSVVEITIEHKLGQLLEGSQQTAFDPGEGDDARLVVNVDGKPVLEKALNQTGQLLVGYARLPVASGPHQILVELTGGGAQSQQLMNEQVELTAGQIRRLAFKDARLNGDPEMGERLFREQVFGVRAGCAICHSLQPGETKVGPSLAGVGSRAGQRVPGLSAEAYLLQSVMEPNAYIVEGFSSGQMPPTFKTILNESQIQDIVAFLLTLK